MSFSGIRELFKLDKLSRMTLNLNRRAVEAGYKKAIKNSRRVKGYSDYIRQLIDDDLSLK